MLILELKDWDKISQGLKDVDRKNSTNKNIKHIRICIKREQLEKKGLLWKLRLFKPTYFNLWTIK